MTILAILGLVLSAVAGPAEKLDFLKPYRDQAKAFITPYTNAVLAYGTGTPELRVVEEQRP